MSYSPEQIEEATNNCKILRGRGGAINAEAVANNPKCKKPKPIGGNCQSTNPTWRTPKTSSSFPMCTDIKYTCPDGYTLEGSCCVPVEEVAPIGTPPIGTATMNDIDDHCNYYAADAAGDNDELKNLIEAALSDLISSRSKKEYADYNKLVGVVKSIVAEYLDSFIVIGYDFDGNVVELQSASNSQQKDALRTLALKYFCFKTGYTIPGVYENEGDL